jgi:hypothetical protein
MVVNPYFTLSKADSVISGQVLTKTLIASEVLNFLIHDLRREEAFENS